MLDYKEMYLKMFRANEQAVRTLVSAQRECEELFVSQPEPGLKIVTISPENKKSTQEA